MFFNKRLTLIVLKESKKCRSHTSKANISRNWRLYNLVLGLQNEASSTLQINFTVLFQNILSFTILNLENISAPKLG